MCSGRKLTWLWNISKAEVRTRYLSTSYIFMVSLYQLAILVQYNAADAFSYAELQTATSLNEVTLRGQLGVLVKNKVLNLVKDDGEENYELNYGSSPNQIPHPSYPPSSLPPTLSLQQNLNPPLPYLFFASSQASRARRSASS